MIDLSIIILSYNTKELLRACLRSIYKTAGASLSYEIIVVDNASPDGSADMVRSGFKEVVLIANKENIGYSKGNNVGVKAAKGRFILFLNADTFVYKETLYAMVRFMQETKRAGAATCNITLPNGKLDEASHRGFPTPWRSFAHFSGFSKLFPYSKLFAGYSLGWMDFTKTHEIDACAGAFMIVQRQAGEGIGWWDEDFFWYGDDLDFCFRLKEKGWKIYFVPTVSILHYKGVSGGIKKISKHLTSATKETRIRVTNARFEAMKTFYNKHYKTKYPAFVTLLVLLTIRIKWWLTLKTL